MPQLPQEMFDTPPKVGDVFTVTGTVQSIKDGMVEASYDKVENRGAEANQEEAPKNSSEALDDYMEKQKGDTQ